MVGLLDIAVKTETVAGVVVRGIGIKDIVVLLTRFPDLRTMLTGGKVETAKLVAIAPDACAAVIAAGCDELTKEAEAKAATFPLELQLDFLEAIQRTTMPSGFGPFVERLESIGVIGPTAKVPRVDGTPAMNSHKPLNT